MEELAIDAVIRRAWFSKPGLLAKYDSALAVMSRALALYRCVNRHVVNDGHVEAIRALVALGADTDAQTEDGETPLQVSIRYNHHEAAQVLKQLQRPITMKKKAVTKEPPTQEAIDAAERMAKLLEEESEEEEEEEERKKAAAAKNKVRSRPAFSHPR